MSNSVISDGQGALGIDYISHTLTFSTISNVTNFCSACVLIKNFSSVMREKYLVLCLMKGPVFNREKGFDTEKSLVCLNVRWGACDVIFLLFCTSSLQLLDVHLVCCISVYQYVPLFMDVNFNLAFRKKLGYLEHPNFGTIFFSRWEKLMTFTQKNKVIYSL